MNRGWYATGRLQPLWDRYGDGDETYRREKLAAAVGTSPSVLSAVNSGSRRLGVGLGTRLANELGITLLDLGQPLAEAGEPGQTVHTRLEQLATQLAETVEKQTKLSNQVARLRARVRQLEAREEPGQDVATGPA